ncbi:hypothetical protein [Burkholderia multivorans]|uniref:hypothetical protein n=1 Tax=Burkholderia multivorans TaxID=87883 RepID=UPI0020168F7F|nr:hypothetical protein [Burkholderia multivorans]
MIGEQVLPVYNRALELTTSVLERLLGFAKEYPTFTRAVAIGAAGLGVLLAVLGTLTITLAAVLGAARDRALQHVDARHPGQCPGARARRPSRGRCCSSAASR